MSYQSPLAAQVEPIIRYAGQILLSFRFKKLERIFKQDAGFYTQADIESEKFIINALQKIDPSIGFLAEEEGEVKQTTNDYCWVIDPLDGTTNFSYGLPHFCISIALTYKHEPVFGMVYQPALDELFYAEKSKGAFLNGQKISVSTTKNIQESLLLFCIPYEKNEEARKLFENMLKLSQQASSLRLLGAAALDQCYTACGRFDGMFFNQLSWWDIAAGSLILQESGGMTSDFQGNPLNPSFKSYIGGNPEIHTALLEKLR